MRGVLFVALLRLRTRCSAVYQYLATTVMAIYTDRHSSTLFQSTPSMLSLFLGEGDLLEFRISLKWIGLRPTKTISGPFYTYRRIHFCIGTA